MVRAHDEQPAGIQIEAIDMTVGPNQIGGRRARQVDGKRAACVGAGEVGAREGCIDGRQRKSPLQRKC